LKGIGELSEAVGSSPSNKRSSNGRSVEKKVDFFVEKPLSGGPASA
jgi:hypothetical protein